MQPVVFKHAQPTCARFARGIAFVPIVIAGADHHPRKLAETQQVFFNHHDLHIDIERPSEIQEVATDDQNIAALGLLRQPVKLL